MAEARVVTVEQRGEAFGELFENTGQMRRELKSLRATVERLEGYVQRRFQEVEKHQTIQGQTIEDLLAGSIALSDSLDDLDAELKAEVARNRAANAEIIALWDRDRQKDIALWAMSLMCQEMELRLQKLEHRFDLVTVGAAESVAAIMSAA